MDRKPTLILMLVSLVVSALLTQAPANATIAVKLDVAGLATAADAVVLGRVLSQESHWEGKRIVTDVAIHVAVPIVGAPDPAQNLTIQVLGGRVDDLAQIVHGTPRFTVGEDVLLFLEETQRARPFRVVGMAQGRFKVQKREDGKLWAVQELAGLTLAEVEPGKKLEILGHQDGDSISLPLDDLIRQVAGSVKNVGNILRPEVTKRLGSALDRPYDFTVDLEGRSQ